MRGRRGPRLFPMFKASPHGGYHSNRGRRLANIRPDPKIKDALTGNPFGDHVFLGVATAMAYKTESWGGCGRHLNPRKSSKVAIDGLFEAVLGKTRRTEF